MCYDKEKRTEITEIKESDSMAVTIQQIAEKAGVSRGTVDRALNNRGRINPEVAEMVKRTAEEMGYVHKARKKQIIYW